MLEIGRLRKFFEEDTVLITNHASERFRQRSIRMRDIREGVLTGEIIEQYPEDHPFPSCLILGYTCDKRPGSRIITAYIPDFEKWEADLKTRKE